MSTLQTPLDDHDPLNKAQTPIRQCKNPIPVFYYPDYWTSDKIVINN